MRTRISWLPLLALCAWAIDPISASPAVPQRMTAAAPNAFGSIALPLDSNQFSNRWNRVAAASSSPKLSELITPARAMTRPGQFRFVNAAVNRSVEFRPDQGDRWSTADETLRRAAGDCEDYVIAKMQALKALGVPERDMFLTVGQDDAARQAHAVLLVRAGGQFWVMDNRSDRLIADSQFRDFKPMISFRADGKSWLHGKRKRLQDPDIRDLLDGKRRRLREPSISDLLAA